MFASPPRHVEGLPRAGRSLVMGVVNVTPDSFSDGGRWTSAAAAVDHGENLYKEGADLVDVGGESTRPGAARPSSAEEIARVLPVVEGLVDSGVVVTVDTMRADVARRAVERGAVAVNDVSGGLADPDMLPLVAELDVPYICMHWRGHAASMQRMAAYGDVVAEVKSELQRRVDAAVAAGVRSSRIAVDPGLGFAKTADHNWSLLAGMEALHALGHPIIVGPSRKAFLGALLAGPEGGLRPTGERDDATAVIAALCAASGAWCVRVHDVGKSLDAIRVAARWAREAVSVVPSVPSPAELPARSWESSPGGLDRLTVRGLRAYGYHGVLPAERRDGQEFVADITMYVDMTKAATSDQLAHTVDYGELTARLAAAISSYPVDLIETLAERLAHVALAEAGVAEVEVTIHKPSAPVPVAVDDVSVTIRRRRDD